MFSRSTLLSLIAEPWLVPDRAFAYFLTRLSSRVCLSTDSFGWLQAIHYSRVIDLWLRYTSVAKQLELLDERSMTILDVGGSRGNIKEFVRAESCRFVILDINLELLRIGRQSSAEVVAGDGCHLPFKDGAFDVVVAVDSLEHVPDSKRAVYCHEMKRVAESYVIIHCPVDSSDGSFRGTAYDTTFLEWHRLKFGKDEPNTVEHLKYGLPKVEELQNLFPSAAIGGTQSGEIWLRCITWQYTPYKRLIVGLLYRFRLQKHDNSPPYHACLLVWRK